MLRILIKFQANYADEFDVYGFFITDREKFDKHLDEVKAKFCKAYLEKQDPEDLDEFQSCFGTNEEIIYSSYADYFRSFEIKEISEDEEKVILKFFPDHYGHVCML